MISVVFPTYNEAGNVKELHRLNKETLDKIGEPYEIIVVDNGSEDGTLDILKSLSPIKIIVFPKNFGQTLALDAGLKAAKGDIVVIMDGDMQNDPRDIPKLLAKMKEGYDVVSGWRKDRHDSLGRKIHSRLANWLTRTISGLPLHDHACALKAYRRKFLEGMNLFGVQHVFLAVSLFFRGAKVTEVEVTHHERKSGMSKHHFTAGVKAIADLLVVRFLHPNTRPMVFFSVLGLLAWGIAGVATAWSVVLAVFFGQPPLPIMATMFAIVGFLMFMLGLLAELLWRIYFETERAHPYFIKEIIER
ncbi:MAG: glycosyl transferase family protein [Parcubacteria group bacterium Gr01-1014_3]|nr:MAG: glycosyl transferase family protein [Parcubacteria group bacterium Gr01-1014_3]